MNLNKLTLKERMLCNENIFLAIYAVQSYVQNKELLSDKDQISLVELRDKFNNDLIDLWIEKVRNRINEILGEKCFFEAKVYFKPKKLDDNNNVIFRPIHTSSLLDQISAVAMMQVLIYEFDNENKIKMSNLARLIPHNFFGNRVAYEPENLYKPWQEQYKNYTSKANELYKKYHDNHEYKWEVNLDLENFFPSINPISLINYINKMLPVTYMDEDRKLINIILQKLIFLKLDKMDKDDISRYSKNLSKSPKFTVGLPQGLPQSYFLANLMMINIEQIYKKFFSGEMLFYVDDSVIYTNNILNLNDLKGKIENANNEIENWITENYEPQNTYLLDDIKEFVHDRINEFVIKIHEPGSKSTISKISENRAGEMYIHFVGRQTSKTAFEINTSYSDEETHILYTKTKAILEAIIKEIESVEIILNKKIISETERKTMEAYRKKIIRYKKFFKYRNQELALRETDDVGELKQELLKDLKFLENKNNIDGKKDFFEKYNEDTLEASISFVLKSLKDAGEDYEDIAEKIVLLNKNLFGKDNKSSSYLYKSYSKYIKGSSINNLDIISMNINNYSKLNQYVKLKYRFNKKTDYVRFNAAKKILNSEQINTCYEKIVGKDFLDKALIVIKNSNTLQRMILNAIFSCIFDIDISDSVILKKNNNRKITYFELRLLELLRNKNFSLNKIREVQENLLQSEYSLYIDYSIMQVIGIFSTFVREPIYIDNLILVHKYTCDIWKNGSKHLYFYTLHNQEHAVELVQNSIKILKSIDYIDISRNDYYVLFIACYLHDISMVTLPDLNKLQQDGYITNKLYSDFINDYNLKESKKDVLKLLKDYYMRIDSFYEKIVRDNHAKDSANEIRNRKELGFIDASLREIVAEISEAHGYDVRDIYKIKSVAKSKMWSMKFTKIILRLADLLDMSNYRVSKLILDHNLDNMGKDSRFHWLSHIVTSGYEIDTKYYLKNSHEPKFLAPGNIVENIIFKINVDLSQMTEEKSMECLKMNLISMDNSSIKLKCGESCKYKKCNFLCKWFAKKNKFLFEELDALQTYLNDLPDNYFSSDIQVIIESSNKNPLTSEQFTLLRDYVTDN